MTELYKVTLHVLFVLLVSVLVLPSCCSTQTLKTQSLPPVMTTTSPQNLNPIYRAHRSTISMIHKGRIGCSAVIIQNRKDKPMLILTASHCILSLNRHRKDKSAPFMFGSLTHKWQVPTEMINISPRTDLALMRSTVVMKQNGVFAELATEEPARASDVWAIGNPGNRGKIKEHNITKGILSNSLKLGKNHVYRTDADIWYGNSGGGLFNSRGQLIGILIQIEPAPGGCYVTGGGNATALPEIRKFVKDSLE